MLNTVIKKVFGSRNERVLKSLQGVVHKINALEPQMQALSDDALKAKTEQFRERLQAGETIKSILPEAFAIVREASVRAMEMRHFDVQLIGGMVLHDGKIAEMRTGEGKTLVATLPAYLNALTGLGVHIITVNDYLAKRDSEWMAPIYEFLGLSVGVIVADMVHEDKQAAYQADITYGTNNEFGFDYLRDNMAFSLDNKVQRPLHYALVDEVDSILIDEARTPLIISGAAEDSSEMYIKINRLVPFLKQQQQEDGPGDYSLDEKQRQAYLTEEGHQRIEQLLIKEKILQEGDSLYHPSNINIMHHLNAALRAHTLYHKDVDYIVTDNEVVIVDEHTGRTMPGRRWSEGLHQAMEAKEGVAIQQENQTLASITFQNYFRMYEKLAGMTGTADTEAYEFQQIYNLEVVVIPTNAPMIRDDMTDLVYLTPKEKFSAIIEDVKECIERKQPVLVGTASIETSEYLSKVLKEEQIKHQVLNAKFHQKEASIIAEAGRPAIVTIATNMAGRGTDIVLGGNLEKELKDLGEKVSEEKKQALKQDWQMRHQQVLDAGGLRIIGSERHESRRIDNQLRGRAGRQGDPGSSRFYLSLEDNLMRIFASERVGVIMKKLGMGEGEAIEHSLVTRAIENAQRKVEGRNFDIRKQLLDYDNVANDQRKVIYSQRADLLAKDDVSEAITMIREDVVNHAISQYIPLQSLEEQWDVPGLCQHLKSDFALQLPIAEWLEAEQNLHEESLRQRILDELVKLYQAKEQMAGHDVMRRLEKSVMLQSLDHHWREHLSAMDYLRQGIHLRGYAQKDPKQEYKRESFALFEDLIDSYKFEIISLLSQVQIQAQEDIDGLEQQRRQQSERTMLYQHAPMQALDDAEQAAEENVDGKAIPFVRNQPKIGRNDPCPCQSGKKYKQCHGRLS